MPYSHAPERARSVARASTRGRTARLARWGRIAAVSAVAAAGVGAAATPALAQNQGGSSSYQFRTIDNAKDLTFNQLLGINDRAIIAGYFGSGADAHHPNQGYVVHPNYHQHDFVSDNFPMSVQTQVTGLNNSGTKVGFYVDANNNQLGFFQKGVNYTKVMDPNSPPVATSSNGNPSVNQLLGINDHDVAVGFYTDANNVNHGYTYDVDTGHSTEITVPGLPTGSSVTASAINNHGTVVGFAALPGSGSETESWIQVADGKTGFLVYPDSTSTSALGISNEGEVVGVYTDVTGNMHGFTWSARGGFSSVDDPKGIGTTTINGVNDRGQLVGFYVDRAKNTDGFLATPVQHHHS